MVELIRHHDGKLTITGNAPNLIVTWSHHAVIEDKTPVGTSELHRNSTSPYELAKLATEAKQALVQLKFPKQRARDAVTAALERLGPDTTLPELIRAALRLL